MNHPLAALFGDRDDENRAHKLSEEAQKMNLRAAWDHYRQPKDFVAGQFVKCRPGLDIFKDEPVICLFVRMLSETSARDMAIITDTTERERWNKVDCIIARAMDEGRVIFLPFDSDILEAAP